MDKDGEIRPIEANFGSVIKENDSDDEGTGREGTGKLDNIQVHEIKVSFDGIEKVKEEN